MSTRQAFPTSSNSCSEVLSSAVRVSCEAVADAITAFASTTVCDNNVSEREMFIAATVSPPVSDSGHFPREREQWPSSLQPAPPVCDDDLCPLERRSLHYLRQSTSRRWWSLSIRGQWPSQLPPVRQSVMIVFVCEKAVAITTLPSPGQPTMLRDRGLWEGNGGVAQPERPGLAHDPAVAQHLHGVSVAGRLLRPRFGQPEHARK